MQTPIALGCDEAAFRLKEAIRAYLEKLGHTVEDFGVYNTRPLSLSRYRRKSSPRSCGDGKVLARDFNVRHWNRHGDHGQETAGRAEDFENRGLFEPGPAFFPEGKPRVLKLRLKTRGGSECMSQ